MAKTNELYYTAKHEKTIVELEDAFDEGFFKPDIFLGHIKKKSGCYEIYIYFIEGADLTKLAQFAIEPML